MAIDQETMNPESRSLTAFSLPGMISSGCSTQSTVIPQPWFQASSASDSGNTICTNYSLEWINNFLSSLLIDSIDSSQAQTNVFPRQPRAFLCPLSSAYPPAPIYYRRLTIGTGINCPSMTLFELLVLFLFFTFLCVRC
jgi:hypothetical protein